MLGRSNVIIVQNPPTPDSGELPPEIDTQKAHPARIYDYMLGGRDNFPVDRETADLQHFESKFAAFPAAQLDLTSQGDLELLLANIHSTLLSLNTIRLWE